MLFSLGLTLFAGLSTGIGSAIAFFAKRTNTRFLAFSLGFSAGVMIYVSMTEITTKARCRNLQADPRLNSKTDPLTKTFSRSGEMPPKEPLPKLSISFFKNIPKIT